MAHFYGWLQGNRGEATRMGAKHSGIGAWVQGWNSRIAVSMDHDEREDKDTGYATFGTGPSNYSGGALSIGFDNLDDVIDVLNQGDPKVEKIREQILAAVKKLDEEAPKAKERIARRKRREQKAREQEEIARVRGMAA